MCVTNLSGIKTYRDINPSDAEKEEIRLFGSTSREEPVTDAMAERYNEFLSIFPENAIIVIA